MDLRQLRPALVLSLFSVLVWTTRIRNIWADDALSLGGQVGRTALAASFTVFAVVTIAAGVHAWRSGGTVIPCTRLWIRAFAIWTVGVWVVRGIQIVTADHPAAFIVVHTVLAVASITLAIWADRRAATAGVADLDQSSPDPSPVTATP